MPPRRQPASLTEAIHTNLLSDQATSFADITLTSTTGTKFPAVRGLLARSPYLHAAFFPAPPTPPPTIISVPASTRALREIIHYAYTDDTLLLRKVSVAAKKAKFRGITAEFGDEEGGEDVWVPELEGDDVVGLVDVVAAAHRLGLGGLAKSGAEALELLVGEVPRTVCLVLEAGMREGGFVEVGKGVLEAGWRTLRQNVVECLTAKDFGRVRRRGREKAGGWPGWEEGLGEKGVLVLGGEVLEMVVRDGDLFVTETFLFEVVYFWARGGKGWVEGEGKEGLEGGEGKVEGGGLGKRGVREGEDGKGEWKKRKVGEDGGKTKERWEKAKELMSGINLERMKPSFLTERVERSGLVGRGRLQEVYKQQALEAARGRALYESFRGGSVWGDGMKRRFEKMGGEGGTFVLKSPWIRGGRHEWTFEVLGEGEVWIGIVGCVLEGRGNFARREGWGFCRDGVCMGKGNVGKRKGPKVGEGGKVRCVLNLVRNGTFTVIVDEGKSFRAFCDLRGVGRQFVPAVYLGRNGGVVLEGEKHVME